MDAKWTCPNCRAVNEPDWDCCDNCAADRDGQVPMSRRIADIQEASNLLDQIALEDDIDLDKALGKIEGLIIEARQDIDRKWRLLRAPRLQAPLLGSEDLEQILRDIDALKPISEVK